MFNWDVIEHEYNGTHYEFEAAGKKWRLPHISDLNNGQIIAADQGRLEIVFRDVAEVWDGKKKSWKSAGDQAALLVLGKHQDQVAAFKVAWLAQAGMEPGESQASSS